MQPITIFHNPKCSKSRRALEILREKGVECDCIEYLKTPPDRATLEWLLRLLAIAPGELVRRDARFAELGLDDAACGSAAQVVDLLLEYPELMERPVVVCGERAVAGRPPEGVPRPARDALRHRVSCRSYARSRSLVPV